MSLSNKFCPSVGVYAAIRMDPVAMVAHLDALATEEAQQIRPKTYLIFTAFGLSIPFPGRPWYGYNVRPIGPSLRAVDEKRGFESDMCAPIFPNETHPACRPSTRPDGVFPYDNCYHWVGMDLDVRVCAREEGFDHTRAIELSVGELMDMALLFRPDLGRAKRARLAREQAASELADHASALESSTPLPTAEHPEDATTTAGEVDIFQPPVDFEDPEYIPLVHLWLDLEANLKQEDIGDPVDLYRERFAIMSIIRRAHERDPDLPTLRDYLALHQDPYVGDSDSDSCASGTNSDCASEASDASEPEDDYVDKPKRLRPAKLFRKLRSSVRGVLCIPF